MSGNPIGDQRERGALRKGSASRNEPSQRGSWEGDWSFPNISLAEKLKLELLVSECVTSNDFLDALRGLPREAPHLTRGEEFYSHLKNERLEMGSGGESLKEKGVFGHLF